MTPKLQDGEIRTHYIDVSDEAPDYIVREAVRIKANQLKDSIHFNDIKVIRESELRKYDTEN